jgi:hypothetical protein
MSPVSSGWGLSPKRTGPAFVSCFLWCLCVLVVRNQLGKEVEGEQAG